MGFSLVELLVVIAIIGVLVTSATIIFTGSRVKSRDTSRAAYINQINTALEIYFLRNGIYPTLITAGEKLTANGNVYLDPVPSNPEPRTDGNCPNSDFTYTTSNNNTSYTLSFCLGGPTGRFAKGQVLCVTSTCKNLAYSDEATALFARFSGTLTYTDKTNIDNLIVAGKSHGWWNKMDLFYVFAIGTNSTDALLNWKSTSFAATNVNSTSWTAYQGFTSNGSSSYLNTNYKPITNATNYSQNSASVGVYIRTNNATIDITNGNVEIGNMGADANYSIQLFPRYTPSGNAYTRLNSSALTNGVVPTAAGFLISSRNNASSVNLYKNGSPLATSSSASTTIRDIDIFVCGCNRSGSSPVYGINQVAVAFLGSGLSADDVTNISNDVNAYMTAVGANVY